MMMMMQNIYNTSGGTSFWIHNTGPIGCLPYILANFPSAERDEAGCSKPHNDVAQYFNYQLKQAVVQLRKELPLAAITYVDVYSAKYSLYKEPQKYGKFFALFMEIKELIILKMNFGKTFCMQGSSSHQLHVVGTEEDTITGAPSVEEQHNLIMEAKYLWVHANDHGVE